MIAASNSINGSLGACRSKCERFPARLGDLALLAQHQNPGEIRARKLPQHAGGNTSERVAGQTDIARDDEPPSARSLEQACEQRLIARRQRMTNRLSVQARRRRTIRRRPDGAMFHPRRRNCAAPVSAVSLSNRW